MYDKQYGRVQYGKRYFDVKFLSAEDIEKIKEHINTANHTYLREDIRNLIYTINYMIADEYGDGELH